MIWFTLGFVGGSIWVLLLALRERRITERTMDRLLCEYLAKCCEVEDYRNALGMVQTAAEIEALPEVEQ